MAVPGAAGEAVAGAGASRRIIANMASDWKAFTPVGHVIETAIDEGTIPGAVILCADAGITRFHQAFGARQLKPDRLPATPDTVYDIASVTKAVSTSVLMMKAVAAGLVALDEPVSGRLPAFHGAGKGAVTARQLLCHAAGLPAHRPYYERWSDLDQAAAGSGHESVAAAAALEPLINAPGAVSVYSDVGYILLGSLLERLTGTELDVLFASEISRPLGLKTMRFVNLGDRSARQEFVRTAEVAPTQYCAARQRPLCGEVDDLNAFVMGGVAGHAGLFSDAADLGTVAAALVHAWQAAPDERTAADAGEGVVPGGSFIVPPPLLREFWQPAGIAGSTWRLGWDGPAAHDSQAGSRMSRQAVGHLGFTGCSLWIDPARAQWIVLLTNRVHPTARLDPRFRAFRAAVHDAAIDALLS